MLEVLALDEVERIDPHVRGAQGAHQEAVRQLTGVPGAVLEIAEAEPLFVCKHPIESPF